MKIFARICAIVSVALFLISLLLTLGVTLGQNVILELLGYNDEFIDGFTIPWDTLIYTALWLICVAALCIGVCTDKTGVVIEIIFIVIAVLMIPIGSFVFSWISSFCQAYLYRFLGMHDSVHYSLVLQYASAAAFLNPLATALAYLGCGISLGRKATQKRLSK